MHLAKWTSVCILGLTSLLLGGSAAENDTDYQTDVTNMLYRLTDPGYQPPAKANANTSQFFAISAEDSTAGPGSLEDRYPDLKGLCGPGKLPRGRAFSAYLSCHMEQVQEITIFILKINDTSEVIEVLGFLRNNINEQIFVYVVGVLVLVHPQMEGFKVPLLQDVLPNKFFTADIISKVRQDILVTDSETTDRQTEAPLVVIDRDFTGSNLNPEHRVAYWREDIGLNAHHWHWHLVYSVNWLPTSARPSRDRKGELFAYMHEQLLARFGAERLANKLPRVIALQDWTQRIPEGYAPHLTSDISGLVYSPRPADLRLKDVRDVVRIDQMVTWYNHIVDSIDRQEYLRQSGNNLSSVSLNNDNGIDVIGNLVESNVMSPDRMYYGNLHNRGHTALARIHDPDDVFQTEMGVMGDLVTAMRDPIFYRWHRFIDDIYQRHKQTLAPYDPQLFDFRSTQIRSIVVSGNISGNSNSLVTYWQTEQLNLAHGINFERQDSVMVRIQHLQHENFTYTITVNNRARTNTLGMVRIFLVPRLNEASEPFDLEDQRRFFIEMDRFTRNFTPGNNVIRRLSSESAVISPSSASFAQPSSDNELRSDSNSYCTCGIPEHLLVPRGTEVGMAFQLFIMISNGTLDRVEDSPPATNANCKAGVTICGILNRKYPDRKPMGFPFDRPFGVDQRLSSIRDLAQGRSNMWLSDMTIRHVNQVFQPNADTSGLASKC